MDIINERYKVKFIEWNAAYWKQLNFNWEIVKIFVIQNTPLQPVSIYVFNAGFVLLIYDTIQTSKRFWFVLCFANNNNTTTVNVFSIF